MPPRRAGRPPGCFALGLFAGTLLLSFLVANAVLAAVDELGLGPDGALGAAAVKVALCWRLARPVEGVVIALPSLPPGLAAAACALLLA